MNHLDKGKSILVIANLLIITLIPYIRPKYINLFVGNIVNKIILLCITFLILFENYILGLSFLLLLWMLINYNSYNESKISR